MRVQPVSGNASIKGRPASAGPTRSAEEAQAKVSAARRAAFEILRLVDSGKGHSDDLLHGFLTEGLSVDDRNLATALVMGVLRWQIALDARVQSLLARPNQRLAEPVLLALRIGAFQLMHMDRIPAHAALSESVELCRAAGQPHATGMVNAILRKVASAQRPKERVYESVAAFAERLGHPRWLVERWIAQYGRDAALKICMADQMEPPANSMFPELLTSPECDLPRMDGGSRLVAEVAAAALPQVSGRPPLVWDCCAAPGGKTLVLALRLPGAALLATDASARRMVQTEARLKRFSYAERVRLAVSDAAALPAIEGPFDLVLCDVPCSGTGTLGRNPEIRHHLTPDDLPRQAERQTQILSAALKRLSAGGRLVYSSCSLEPEENERVVASVIGTNFKQMPIGEFVAEVPSLSGVDSEPGVYPIVRDGIVRTLPGVHPCDGFFVTVLERA